jgi:hypothetical protein
MLRVAILRHFERISARAHTYIYIIIFFSRVHMTLWTDILTTQLLALTNIYLPELSFF